MYTALHLPPHHKSKAITSNNPPLPAHHLAWLMTSCVPDDFVAVAEGEVPVLDAVIDEEAVGVAVPDAGNNVVSATKAAEFPLAFWHAWVIELEIPATKLTAAHYTPLSAKHTMSTPLADPYLVMHAILSILNNLQQPNTSSKTRRYTQSRLAESSQAIFCNKR